MNAETKKLIRQALREDKTSRDITTLSIVPAGTVATARLVARQSGVLCGVGVFADVFRTVDRRCAVTRRAQDGDRIRPGQTVAVVKGPARAILSAERTALNFIQHLSGIATRTAAFARRLSGTRAKVYDTRKTLPGMRALAKYAVRCGGGENHRMDLSEMALIKDNHLQLIKDLSQTVNHLKRAKAGLKVQVECEDHAQVLAALQAGCDLIMFDNMSPAALRRAVALVRDYCARHRVRRPQLEVSGGVRIDGLRSLAGLGVDRISVGAITHSAPALDLSLEIGL